MEHNYGTHVVIYIAIFALYEDTALSLGFCEASDFIKQIYDLYA